MKYQTTDFRNGLKIAIEGKPFIVVSFQHTNPGKGSVFVKARVKNLETGQVLEKTFKSGVDTVDKPDMEEREMEYTYGDMDGYNFMGNVGLTKGGDFSFFCEEIWDAFLF